MRESNGCEKMIKLKWNDESEIKNIKQTNLFDSIKVNNIAQVEDDVGGEHPFWWKFIGSRELWNNRATFHW